MAPTQINKIGPFQIREEIRRDAFSITYLAFDPKQKHTLALRILNPEFASDPLFARRFIKAGQTAALLHQENIVEVYEAGEIDGHYYIAAELVTGQTLLSVLIRRQKLLSPTEVTGILQQVAAGLDYLHSQGLLYIDLSFRDILINEAGHAMLTDVGMYELRQATPPRGTDGQTEPTADVSTFTSPEQARGAAGIDRRSDIYSLGVIGYAMLAGRLPFEAADPGILKREIIEQAPPDPILLNPHIPPHVASVLTTVLAKEPDQRYASAGEFASVLTRSLLWETDAEALALLSGDPVQAESEPQPRSKRGLAILATALVALVALLLGTLFARPALLATLGFTDDAGAGTVSTQALAPTLQPSFIVTATQTAESNALAQAATMTASSIFTPVEEITATLAVTLVAANTDTPVPTVLAPPTVTMQLVLVPTPIPTNTQINAVQAANTTAVEGPEIITPTLVTTITNPLTSSNTLTPTVPPTPTNAPTNTNTPVPTATSTNSATPIPTATATIIPTNTAAPTNTLTPTNTPVPTTTPTTAPTNTAAPTATATATNSPVPTATPLPTNTLAPTPTATAMATSTNTALPTATATAIILPTNTYTAVPVVTSTPLPTATATALPITTDTPLPPATATPLPPATATPLPTATATALPIATDTPLPTATSTPLPTATATALPIATATNTPLPTATPTFTATSTVIPTPSATFTSLPTATATTPPTATATRTPIPPSFDASTLRQPLNDGTARMRGAGQPGSTVQVLVNNAVAGTTVVRPNGAWTLAVVLGKPGSYQLGVRAVYANGKVVQATTRPITVIVPAPTPLPTPTVTIGSIQLVAPGNNTANSGLEEFRWTANFTPDSGLAFEVILWKAGQDPLVSGFGLAAPTTSNKINVDLNALDAKLGDLLEPGDYQWGVLLVRVSPYQRVQFMGQARTFRFDRGSNDNGGGGSSGGGQKSGE